MMRPLSVGMREVVSGLLLAGARSDAKLVVVLQTSKRSALYTAGMLGHEDVARKLVLAGAASFTNRFAGDMASS